jgi:hypothetical protein
MRDTILTISKEEVYNLLRFGKTSGKCLFFGEDVEFIDGKEEKCGESSSIINEIRVEGWEK